MPPLIKRDEEPLKKPTTDPEWTALTDEQLAPMTGQRANSEKIARKRRSELNTKINGQPRYRLAINVHDPDRLDDVTRQSLLGPVSFVRPLIWVDKNVEDEQALEFACDLLTAATVCDVIRMHDKKAGDVPCRVYVMRQRHARQLDAVNPSTWVKLPADALLTIISGGRCILNPKLFPSEEIASVAYTPLLRKIVRPGRK